MSGATYNAARDELAALSAYRSGPSRRNISAASKRRRSSGESEAAQGLPKRGWAKGRWVSPRARMWEPFVIPVQRLQDRVFRTTYPGLELVNQPFGADGFENLLHSSAAPLPERDYRAPNSNKNRGAYLNPDYDALMDRYRVTIPMTERMQVMAQLIHLQTDLQLVMGLYYSADAIVMANRLRNVPPANTWNVQNWDVA